MFTNSYFSRNLIKPSSTQKSPQFVYFSIRFNQKSKYTNLLSSPTLVSWRGLPNIKQNDQFEGKKGGKKQQSSTLTVWSHWKTKSWILLLLRSFFKSIKIDSDRACTFGDGIANSRNKSKIAFSILTNYLFSCCLVCAVDMFSIILVSVRSILCFGKWFYGESDFLLNK